MSEIVKVRFAKGWLSRTIEDARVALMARDMARKNPQAVLDAAAEITRLEAEVSRLTNLAQEGLEEAAKWHDQRAIDTPDAFEMEFHKTSAAAIRALIPQEQGEKGK